MIENCEKQLIGAINAALNKRFCKTYHEDFNVCGKLDISVKIHWLCRLIRGFCAQTEGERFGSVLRWKIGEDLEEEDAFDDSAGSAELSLSERV